LVACLGFHFKQTFLFFGWQNCIIFVTRLRINVFCENIFIGVVIALVLDYSSVNNYSFLWYRFRSLLSANNFECWCSVSIVIIEGWCEDLDLYVY
jgi:hypothetical protein